MTPKGVSQQSERIFALLLFQNTLNYKLNFRFSQGSKIRHQRSRSGQSLISSKAHLRIAWRAVDLDLFEAPRVQLDAVRPVAILRLKVALSRAGRLPDVAIEVHRKRSR